MDEVWKALANSVRRRMLDVLADGPATTGELASQFPELYRFAVMQHLGVLETADLVVARKVGRRRINHLNPVPIQRISDRWIDFYRCPLAVALVDLKAQLESEAGAESGAASGPGTTQKGAS